MTLAETPPVRIQRFLIAGEKCELTPLGFVRTDDFIGTATELSIRWLFLFPVVEGPGVRKLSTETGTAIGGFETDFSEN